MKKNKVLLVVLLILLMLCTACGEKKQQTKEGTHIQAKDVEKKDKEEEKNKKTSFLCSNQKIKIETPLSWAEYNEEKMNEDSCLELIGNANEKILLIISEEKKQFDGFNSWFNVVYGTAKKSYGLEDNQVRRSDEGGLNTRFIEKELNSEGTDIYLQLYFMETNNYYNQVLIWTEAKNKDLYSAEFRDIAYSLREIE